MTDDDRLAAEDADEMGQPMTPAMHQAEAYADAHSNDYRGDEERWKHTAMAWHAGYSAAEAERARLVAALTPLVEAAKEVVDYDSLEDSCSNCGAASREGCAARDCAFEPLRVAIPAAAAVLQEMKVSDVHHL